MDRAELRESLIPFEQLGKERELPFRIARLDDPASGLERGQYVLRIVAPWAAGKSFDEIMNPLLELLWMSTDVKTRAAISAIYVVPAEQAWELASQFVAA